MSKNIGPDVDIYQHAESRTAFALIPVSICDVSERTQAYFKETQRIMIFHMCDLDFFVILYFDVSS